MVELDGGHGEGGGQILRTALSLSCVSGVPFRIVGIRRNRSNPGLQPQHLMAVRAAASICRAEVEGDRMGAQDLVFRPRKVRAGNYSFDIGTAGSTALLLQTLLVPLVFAQGPSRVLLTGGTHVQMSPPFDYLQSVFASFLGLIGLRPDLSLERYGFYPVGGGKLAATVRPYDRAGFSPVHLVDRPRYVRVQGVSAVGNLPVTIAERQRGAAAGVLKDNGLEGEVEVKSVDSPGQGTYIFLRVEGNCAAGFSSIGRRGKRAEVVGTEAASDLVAYYRTGTCLDPHLADQIPLYLSLARGRSTFSTSLITEHLLTNLFIIRNLLPISYEVQGERGEPGVVTVNGTGYDGVQNVAAP